MRLIVALCLALFVVSPAFADAGPDLVVAADHAAGSAATAVTTHVNDAVPEPVKAALPDPAEDPAEAASLVVKAYKGGHLVPMAILLAFFGLKLAQRWIKWLKVGWRKLAVASALGGLTMLAERAASGTSPNWLMVMGAIGVAISMAVNAKGDEPEPAVG